MCIYVLVACARHSFTIVTTRKHLLLPSQSLFPISQPNNSIPQRLTDTVGVAVEVAAPHASPIHFLGRVVANRGGVIFAAIGQARVLVVGAVVCARELDTTLALAGHD